MALMHLESNFDELTSNVAVIDFYATWCGPCKMFGPIFEDVSNSYDINFIKIDVDKYSDISRKYGVMSIPTIIFIKDGKEIAKHTGFMSKEQFIDFIEKNNS